MNYTFKEKIGNIRSAKSLQEAIEIVEDFESTQQNDEYLDFLITTLLTKQKLRATLETNPKSITDSPIILSSIKDGKITAQTLNKFGKIAFTTNDLEELHISHPEILNQIEFLEIKDTHNLSANSGDNIKAKYQFLTKLENLKGLSLKGILPPNQEEKPHEGNKSHRYITYLINNFKHKLQALEIDASDYQHTDTTKTRDDHDSNRSVSTIELLRDIISSEGTNKLKKLKIFSKHKLSFPVGSLQNSPLLESLEELTIIADRIDISSEEERIITFKQLKKFTTNVSFKFPIDSKTRFEVIPLNESAKFLHDILREGSNAYIGNKSKLPDYMTQEMVNLIEQSKIGIYYKIKPQRIIIGDDFWLQSNEKYRSEVIRLLELAKKNKTHIHTQICTNKHSLLDIIIDYSDSIDISIFFERIDFRRYQNCKIIHINCFTDTKISIKDLSSVENLTIGYDIDEVTSEYSKKNPLSVITGLNKYPDNEIDYKTITKILDNESPLSPHEICLKALQIKGKAFDIPNIKYEVDGTFRITIIEQEEEEEQSNLSDLHNILSKNKSDQILLEGFNISYIKPHAYYHGRTLILNLCDIEEISELEKTVSAFPNLERLTLRDCGVEIEEIPESIKTNIEVLIEN